MPAKKSRVTPKTKAKKKARKSVTAIRKATAVKRVRPTATKKKAKPVAVSEVEVEKVFVVCTANPDHTDMNSHVEKGAFERDGATCGCGAPLRARVGSIKTPGGELPF